MYIVTV